MLLAREGSRAAAVVRVDEVGGTLMGRKDASRVRVKPKSSAEFAAAPTTLNFRGAGAESSRTDSQRERIVRGKVSRPGDDSDPDAPGPCRRRACETRSNAKSATPRLDSCQSDDLQCSICEPAGQSRYSLRRVDPLLKRGSSSFGFVPSSRPSPIGETFRSQAARCRRLSLIDTAELQRVEITLLAREKR